MSLKIADYYLTFISQAIPGILKILGDVETDYLRNRLEGITLDRPVFITGLARAGTTILLNLFSSLPNIGTHQYRDFPFVFVPYAWSKYQDRVSKPQEPFERAHKDRIKITKDSPEAFEEPIWRYFFPFVHDPDEQHVLTAEHDNPKFNTFYIEHLRKMLLLRGGKRYVSKGNYNISRMEYIANLLPDAQFVVPIRHPLTHVNSLVRQNQLFSDYTVEEKRVPKFMRAAGHYEFGPQRLPINLDKESPGLILEAWENGQDDIGYAVMWRSVYKYVHNITQPGSPLEKKIRIVRYEDFCTDPKTVLQALLQFSRITDGVAELLDTLPDISPPPYDLDYLPEEHRNRVWRETAEVAELFGYRKDRARPVPNNGEEMESPKQCAQL